MADQFALQPGQQPDALFDFTVPTPPVITSTPLDLTVQNGEAVMVEHSEAVPVPMMGGKAVGTPEWSARRIYTAQLVIDPDKVLRRGWGITKDERDRDENYLLLRTSIHQTGINVEPLLCEVTGQMVTIAGEEHPQLRVRSGVRRYYALADLELPEALVRVLPANTEEKERLIIGLLQNEMREPLSILDKCDAVALLYHGYKLKQHVIAARLGYSQGYVVKLIAAGSERSQNIRMHLSQKHLGLIQVYILSQIPDIATRELAARYCILHELNDNQTESLKVELTVPEEQGGPTCVLLPGSNGEVIKQQMAGNVSTTKNAPAPKPPKDVPYWERRVPMYASPMKLRNDRHEVTAYGTREHPQVDVSTLRLVSFVQDLVKKRVKVIDFEALEEAVQADMEASRKAIEQLADFDADADVINEDDDIDADIFDSTG